MIVYSTDGGSAVHVEPDCDTIARSATISIGYQSMRALTQADLWQQATPCSLCTLETLLDYQISRPQPHPHTVCLTTTSPRGAQSTARRRRRTGSRQRRGNVRNDLLRRLAGRHRLRLVESPMGVAVVAELSSVSASIVTQWLRPLPLPPAGSAGNGPSDEVISAALGVVVAGAVKFPEPGEEELVRQLWDSAYALAD